MAKGIVAGIRLQAGECPWFLLARVVRFVLPVPSVAQRSGYTALVIPVHQKHWDLTGSSQMERVFALKWQESQDHRMVWVKRNL